MDLKKELIERNRETKRIFDLIDKLEPALEYDENQDGASVDDSFLRTSSNGSLVPIEGQQPTDVQKTPKVQIEPADRDDLLKITEPDSRSRMQNVSKHLTDNFSLSSNQQQEPLIDAKSSPTIKAIKAQANLKKENEQRPVILEADDEEQPDSAMPVEATHVRRSLSGGLNADSGPRAKDADQNIFGMVAQSDSSNIGTGVQKVPKMQLLDAEESPSQRSGVDNSPQAQVQNDTKALSLRKRNRSDAPNVQEVRIFKDERSPGLPFGKNTGLKNSEAIDPGDNPESLRKAGRKHSNDTLSNSKFRIQRAGSILTCSEQKMPAKQPLQLTANEVELLEDIKERMLLHMRDEAQKKAREAETSPNKFGGLQGTMKARSDLVTKLQKSLTAQFEKQISEHRKKETSTAPVNSDQNTPGQKMMAKLRSILQTKIAAFQKSAAPTQPRGFKVSANTTSEDKLANRDRIMSCLNQMGTAFGMAGPQIGVRKSLPAQSLSPRKINSDLFSLTARRSSQAPPTMAEVNERLEAQPEVKRYQLSSLERNKSIMMEKLIFEKMGPVVQHSNRSKLARLIMDQIDNLPKPGSKTNDGTLSHSAVISPTSDSEEANQNDLFKQMLAAVQKQGASTLFSFLGKRDIASGKMQMTRQLNELQNKKRQKEQQLADLYAELEQMTKLNVGEEIAKIQVSEKIGAQEIEWKDKMKNSLTQSKVEQAQIDACLYQHQFKYNDMQSCFERKELLIRKLAVVQQRLTEEEHMHASYTEMLKGAKSEHRHCADRNAELMEQEADLSHIIEELDQMNYIERKRNYQLNSMHLETRKKIDLEHEKMVVLLKEKEAELVLEEDETKRVLYSLLQNMRRLKRDKLVMKKIEGLKADQLQRQQEVFEAFAQFQEQIKMLGIYWQMHLLKQYNHDIEELERSEMTEDGKQNDDKIRLKGLKLIEKLKHDIFSAKYDWCFEIIYPTKQARMRRAALKTGQHKFKNVKVKLHAIQALQQKTGSSDTARANTQLHGVGDRGSASSEAMNNLNHETGETKSCVDDSPISRPEMLTPPAAANRASTGWAEARITSKAKKGELAHQRLKMHQQQLGETAEAGSGHLTGGSGPAGVTTPQTSERSVAITLGIISDTEDETPDTTGAKQQMRLEQYMKKKAEFDIKFNYIANLATQINSDSLMRIYNHSSIKFTSLRQEFKNGEQERAERLQMTPILQAKVQFFANEIELVGEYIRSLNVDEPLNLRPLEDTIKIAAGDEKLKRPGLIFPISLEGRKILIDELQIKDESLIESIRKTNDLVKEFYSGFKHCIQISVQRMIIMMNAVSHILAFDFGDQQVVTELSERYQGTAMKNYPSPASATTPTAGTKGFSLPSNRKSLGKKTTTLKQITSKAISEKSNVASVIRTLTVKPKDNQYLSLAGGKTEGPKEPLSDVSESDVEVDMQGDCSCPSDVVSRPASGRTRNQPEGSSLYRNTAKSLTRSQRAIQSDLFRLFNIFSGAEERVQLAEKFLKRVGQRRVASMFNVDPKQRFRTITDGLSEAVPGAEDGKTEKPQKLISLDTFKHMHNHENCDENLLLDDFDPIYRRKDAGSVRAGAMHMLGMDSQPRRHISIGAGNLGGMTAKDRLKYKLLAQKALASIQRVQDDDQVEFEREADEEAKRQKAAAAVLRKKDMISNTLSAVSSLTQSKDQEDGSSSSASGDGDVVGSASSLKVSKRKKKKKEVRQFNQEHFDKKIEEHNLKSEKQRQKQNWFSLKQQAQSMERHETFFIKDLQSKINSRYDQLRMSFIQTYENPTGKQDQDPFSPTSLALETDGDAAGTRRTVKKPMDRMPSWGRLTVHVKNALDRNSLKGGARAQRNAFTGYGQRGCAKHGSLEPPAANLSAQNRVKKLYTSLVQAASSIGKHDYDQDEEQRRIFEKIRPDLRNDLFFDAADAALRGENDQIDLKRMQQAVSQQFAEAPMLWAPPEARRSSGGHLQEGARVNRLLDNTGSPKDDAGAFGRAALNSSQLPTRAGWLSPVGGEPKYGSAARGASIKERIAINKELCKSVKLKPRKHANDLTVQEIYMKNKDKINAPMQKMNTSSRPECFTSPLGTAHKNPVYSKMAGILGAAVALARGQSISPTKMSSTPFGLNSVKSAEDGTPGTSRTRSDLKQNILLQQPTNAGQRKQESVMAAGRPASKFNKAYGGFDGSIQKRKIAKLPISTKHILESTQTYTTNQAFNLTYNTVGAAAKTPWPQGNKVGANAPPRTTK